MRRERRFQSAGVRTRLATFLALVIGLSSQGLTPAKPAAAQGQIRVLNNGTPINFGAVPPQMVSGRVLVPLRSVFEALGARVDYDAATRTVMAARGATTLELVIGSAQANVNGQIQFLDVPAQVRLGSTLVPLRFVSQALGASVSWDAASQTVYITSQADASVPVTTPVTSPAPTPVTSPAAQSSMSITITHPEHASTLQNLTHMAGSANGGSGIQRVSVYLVRNRGGGAEYWNNTAKVWQGKSVFMNASLSTPGATVTQWNVTQSLPSGADLPAGRYHMSAYAYDRTEKNAYSGSKSFSIASLGSLSPSPTPIPPPTSPYAAPGSATTVTGTINKVDTTPPPNILLREGNDIRVYQIASNVLVYRRLTATAPNSTQPVETVAQITLSALVPGEEARLLLDQNKQVTQIVAATRLVAARIQFANANQIVLDDGRNTTLTIGPNLRYLNAQGQSTANAVLQPGQTVALFVAPTNLTIYQVSSRAEDITRAQGGTPATVVPTPVPTPAQAGAALAVQVVQHNATRPLKAGDVLSVTVRGTPRMTGHFAISPRLTRLPLKETSTPGVYTGTYTVRANDDILASRVTATLAGNGQESVAQSQLPVTIDTIAPRIAYAQPRDVTVPLDKPNIIVYANDLNGSGLGSAKMTITNGGQTFEIPVTVAPESVSAVPTRALSGTVTVNVTIQDKAGNAVTDRFNFTARPVGAISSVTHSATRPLQIGETITVEMRAQPRGRASFDVLDASKKLVAQAVPMTEIEDGRYQGTYLMQTRDSGDLQIVGRFVDTATGQTTTANATTVVRVLGAAPTVPTISQPLNDQQVASPLVIRGRAAPNSTVEVSIKAEGTQLFLFRYEAELGTQQVKVDANGNWATTAIELPKAPSGVRNMSYTISAVQIDAANRRSDAATVTVRP